MARSRLLILFLAVLCGCSGSKAHPPVLVSAVSGVPGVAVDNIPSGVTRIFVIGYYLGTGTVIFWNGRPQKTTFVDQSAPGILDVVPPPGMVAAAVQVDLDESAAVPGSPAQLTASSGDSPLSEPLEVQIFTAPFAFSGVAPAQLDLGAATTLSLSGTGFQRETQAFLDGAQLPVTFLSSTSLSVQVPAALSGSPGDRFVQLLQVPCSADQTTCDGSPPEFSLLQIVNVGPAGTRLTVPGRTSDTVWDATDSLLFADVQQPSGSHLIASVYPATGNITASLPLQKAARLQISAGDKFLYTAGDVSTPLQRYALPGLASLTTISGPPVGPFAASPDAALTVAFSGAQTGVIDGTTQRPSLDGSAEAAVLAWGPDASTLYGFTATNPLPLAFHVDASGITGDAPLSSNSFGVPGELIFDRVTRRLYTNSGETYDEQGGLQFFAIGQHSSPIDGCPMAIDGALGKAFFACVESGLTTVRSFDLGTRQFIARVVLSMGISAGTSTITTFPLRLVRWGTNGLALGTTDGLYLYSGPFVR